MASQQPKFAMLQNSERIACDSYDLSDILVSYVAHCPIVATTFFSLHNHFVIANSVYERVRESVEARDVKRTQMDLCMASAEDCSSLGPVHAPREFRGTKIFIRESGDGPCTHTTLV